MVKNLFPSASKFFSSEAENGEDKQRRVGRMGGETPLSLDTPESDTSESKKKPPLMRYVSRPETNVLSVQPDTSQASSWLMASYTVYLF